MDTTTRSRLIGAIVAALLLIGVVAGGIVLFIGGQVSQSIETAAQIITALVLVWTLVMLTRELEHIQEQNAHSQVQNEQFRVQNDLQRAVASKSAIQELNKVLLDEQQEDFLHFVFPGENAEEARQAMMAFSLMNSLEMLYLTRDDLEKKENHEKREEFKALLEGFIQNVRVHWEREGGQFPTVYHPGFQRIVNEVFDEPDKVEKK